MSKLCLVRDSSYEYGICTLERDHSGVVHQEILEDGTLWAEWRSILRSDEDNRADEYVEPKRRERNEE